MHIVVCLKQIIDPEIPPRDFKIDPERKEAVQGKASLVISTFDEIALEVALQLRDRIGEGKITAISFGAPTAEEALRKALAMRADDAVLVLNEGLGRLDGESVARVLAAAIRKLEPADLVLCGRQAGDTDAGQVGLLLAEELGLSTVTAVIQVEPADGRLRFRREAEGGFEVVEAALPVLATATNADVNVPRIPKVKDVMQSYRKPLTKWSVADLGLDAASLGQGAAEVVDLFIPVHEGECEIIDGESAEEKAEKLARRLIELKVL